MKKVMMAIFLLVSQFIQAQVISGPMIGHTDLRTSTIWMYFNNDIKEAKLVYYKKGILKKYFKLQYCFWFI